MAEDPGIEMSGTPAKRPSQVTLQGRYVTLDHLQPELHFDDLWRSTSGAENDQLWRYLPSGPYSERASFDEDFLGRSQSEDPFFFAIISADTNKTLGVASYMRIEPGHRVIEVGSILFSADLQHTSGGTEAMYLMARHAFEDLGYRRYEWKCNALNGPSRRAALRLGFEYEGTFRQHMIIKGRNRDTAWFSMLDSEWPIRKTAFKEWLDSANFDGEGRQKRSLSSIREHLQAGDK